MSESSSTSEMQLFCVKIPSNDLAFSNAVYVSMNDFVQLQGTTNRVMVRSIQHKNCAVFPVIGHPLVEDGGIGMSGLQRESFDFGLSQPLRVRPFVLDPQECRAVSNISFVLDYRSKVRATLKEDDVKADFFAQHKGGVFANGQKFPMKLSRGGVVVFEIVKLEAFRRRKSVNTTTYDDGEEGGITESIMNGVVNADTMVVIRANKNNLLKWEGTKGRKDLFKAEANYQDLGIGGLDNEFNRIFKRAFTSRLYPPELIKKMGIQHVKGVLLYGPPGTGKTLIARQIGKILDGHEPKVVNGPEVLNKYVGQTEENVRKLFEDAEKEYAEEGENSQLHIIIFDEIDAICKARGSVRNGTGVSDTLVNQLLSKIDGVNSLNNVLIIGMTNRKDLLDEALLRPGRLEVKVEIGLPDESGREQIFRIHTKNLRSNGYLGADVDLEQLAVETKNYSGAEIAGVVRAATQSALHENVNTLRLSVNNKESDPVVTMAHFRDALTEIPPAFGRDNDELAACLRGQFIMWGEPIRQLMKTGQDIARQLRDSRGSSLLTLLLEGPKGSGKTGIAAKLAMESGFSLVKLISPDQLVSYPEQLRTQRITQVFEDAYKSDTSVIIIDNIERLLDYTPIGPRFSNNILQTLLVLVSKQPPNAKRKLLVIATCGDKRVLEDMMLREAFNFVLPVPQISHPEEVEEVFKESEVDVSASDLQEICTKHTPFPIGVKTLTMLIDMACISGDNDGESCVTAADYAACVRNTGLQERAAQDMRTLQQQFEAKLSALRSLNDDNPQM